VTPEIDVQSSITERNVASAVACVAWSSARSDFEKSTSGVLVEVLPLLLAFVFAAEKCNKTCSLRADFVMHVLYARTLSASDTVAAFDNAGAR